MPNEIRCPNCKLYNPPSAERCDCGFVFRENAGPIVLRQAAGSPAPGVMRVEVTDVDISFGSMVTLMVKAAIAAIPALVLLALLAFVAVKLFGLALSLPR